LKLLGHEVAVAHDGLRALEVAREFRPEVALLDVGLLHIDSYELARQTGLLRWKLRHEAPLECLRERGKVAIFSPLPGRQCLHLLFECFDVLGPEARIHHTGVLGKDGGYRRVYLRLLGWFHPNFSCDYDPCSDANLLIN